MNRREKRNKKKEINVLREVITIINQYFPDLIQNESDIYSKINGINV